jgi:hypothetical protein
MYIQGFYENKKKVYIQKSCSQLKKREKKEKKNIYIYKYKLYESMKFIQVIIYFKGSKLQIIKIKC